MLNRYHRRKLHENAVRYAANGWPVAPLAVPRNGACPCGNGKTCPEPHLVGDEVVRDGSRAAAVWSENQPAWEIALVAEWVDVMELPAEYGAVLNHRVKSGCPTAMAPATRRWMFFVVRGSVPREQVERVGGVLRSGVRDWVAAPGTWTEETGRIRWLVHPYLTEWRPYQRRDPIDLAFL
ncbi:hypothetical protein GCM10009554_73840 [Kribbella koreensis]|uniref:Bifunctional DNA primase/polymerase-like protein n=1 Tax=Kribbella koreensis TaxID=57909 RepID=A0ABP4C5M1_9ACTN